MPRFYNLGEIGTPQYEVEVSFGPISVISITDNLHISLSSLITHFTSFLKTRDLNSILEEPRDLTLREMEVNRALNQPYVQVCAPEKNFIFYAWFSLILPYFRVQALWMYAWKAGRQLIYLLDFYVILKKRWWEIEKFKFHSKKVKIFL